MDSLHRSYLWAFLAHLDEHLLHFLKEFGLILFVYSIGLEVGPSFFSSFKNGGKSLNLLSIIVIALSIITTLGIYSISETSITSMAAGRALKRSLWVPSG